MDIENKKATRESYGEALVLLGEENKNIVVLDADLSTATKSGKVTARYPAYGYDSKLSGMYTVRVNTFLSLRDGGSTTNEELCKLYNGDIVICYGYYTKDFLYIQFTRDNVIYTGFAHKDYLYRV